MNKQLSFLFFFSFALNFTGCTSMQVNKDVQIEQVTRQLNIALQEPVGWLDFKTEKYPIWFYSKQQSNLFLYFHLKLQKLDLNDNKSELPQGSFVSVSPTIKGQRTLVINVDHESFKSSEDLTHYVLKESFKSFYQQSNPHWVKVTSKTINPYFPSLERPRYYRYEMSQSLEEFLKTNQASHLQAVTWWYNKWKKEFPEEFSQLMDREKGTAEFVANSFYLNSQKNRESSLVALYKKRNFKSFNYKFELFDLEKEAEFLGLLSGLTLQILEKTPHRWKGQVNKGQSSLDLLARKFKATPQSPNVNVLDEYIQINVKKMEILDPLNLLSSAVQKLSNEHNIRVVLNNSKVKNSSPRNKGVFKSFFNFKNVDHVSLTWLTTPLDLKSSSFDYPLNADEIWIKALKTPCHPNRESTILIFELPDNKSLLQLQESKYKKVTTGKTLWYCIN